MLSIPGWSILEESNLLAFKSGVRIPLLNFVWRDPTPENIEKIKLFYLQHSFSWLLTSDQNNQYLLSAG
jgi:hypothetical protein